MFANTLFKTIAYHPNECQVITSGTDRKIGYWENFDGSLIRELEGSKAGSVNGLDITADGTYFVTGGNDKLVKVSLENSSLLLLYYMHFMVSCQLLTAFCAVCMF